MLGLGRLIGFYSTASVGLSHKKSEIKPSGFVKFLPKAKVKSLRGEILLCKVAVKYWIKHLCVHIDSAVSS